MSNRSRSLFAQQRDAKRAAVMASNESVLDKEAVYAVEQCVQGAYKRGEPQFVSIEFIESLRDAAFCLGVDFARTVAPFFDTLDEYDRCMYAWRGADSHGWAVLMFDGARYANIALVGAPGLEKLVGTFEYSLCCERSAICLRNVGPYAELLIEPCDGDVQLRVPETGTHVLLRNMTPQRLRVAPAAPSYFDGNRE